jgi:hypothetical protein
MFARFSTLRTLAVLTLPFFLVPGASAADPPPKAKPKDPQAAWMAAKPVVDRFIAAVDAAREAELKRLEKDLFSRPLDNAVLFARDTLGRKSDLSLDAAGEAFGVFQDAINAVFGAGSVNADATRTDHFGDGVRKDLQYEFQPEEVQARLRASAIRFTQRIREEESRALVELGIDADLPALPLHFPSDFRSVVEEEIDRFVKLAHEIVSGDVMVGIGRFGLAAILGDKASDQVVAPDANAIAKIGATIAIGNQVDRALTGLLNQTGYDPKSLIAKAYVAMIDRLRSRLSNGSEDGPVFDRAISVAYSHPDPEVRKEAKRTVDLLCRRSDIGSLRNYHRFCRSMVLRLYETVYRNHTGFDQPELLFIGPDPAKLPPAAKLIEEFRAARRRWEAAK